MNQSKGCCMKWTSLLLNNRTKKYLICLLMVVSFVLLAGNRMCPGQALWNELVNLAIIL
jgi:hypothetical protein